MEEQQSPMTVWCGGINADQDVSIRLIPNGINQQLMTNLRSREPLAVFKVHSNQLMKHSKYFQACLSERWTHPPSPPSMEFSLELIHGLQVASYTDCFSRMYTPLRKNFKGVKSSLELLRVASQIEFHQLVNSICRYLSTILWSEEDELRIRQFSSSPDFPRSQAKDLVSRLEIGEHGNEGYRKILLCNYIVHNIRVALCQDGSLRESFVSAQSLFEDLFSSIGQSEIDSAFEIDVVTIVSKEVKGMLESFHEDCRKRAIFDDRWGETSVRIMIEDEHIFDFRGKLKALSWALELLLKTQVAEEVIECLLHLELYFPIILAAQAIDSRLPTSRNIAVQFCKLVISIFKEVAAGRLLLEIPDRVLLIESWRCLHIFHNLYIPKNDIRVIWGFGQAVEGVFLTLPLEQQLEVLQRNNFLASGFISRSLLIALMKTNWPAEEEIDEETDTEDDEEADEEADVEADV